MRLREREREEVWDRGIFEWGVCACILRLSLTTVAVRVEIELCVYLCVYVRAVTKFFGRFFFLKVVCERLKGVLSIMVTEVVISVW